MKQSDGLSRAVMENSRGILNKAEGDPAGSVPCPPVFSRKDEEMKKNTFSVKDLTIYFPYAILVQNRFCIGVS